jgi:hypothetical protein
MTYLLKKQIAELMDDTWSRYACDDHKVIEELTLIVGYAHMAEWQPGYPEYLHRLHEHLQSLADLASTHGLTHLSDHLLKISGGMPLAAFR